jgi:hypothetical protein
MLKQNLIQLGEFRDFSPAREVILLDQGDDELPFERIKCVELCEIGHAWLEMPRIDGEPLPRWSEFQPKNFSATLDKLCVLKVRNWQQNEIEFSLYGGHPTDFIGLGQPLVMQELRNDPLRVSNYIDIRDRAGMAIDNEAPQYVRKTLSWNDENYIEYETLMLPFMPADGEQRLLQPVSARARLRKPDPDAPPIWCEVSRRER